MEGAGASNQTDVRPDRLHARNRRSLVATEGVAAAVGCLVGIAYTRSDGRPEWALAVGLVLAVAFGLMELAWATEWTIADNELSRRRWLSRPGSRPSLVMKLGPEVEFVRDTVAVWRIHPKECAFRIWPWETAALVGAMGSAGVRIRDWEHGYRGRTAVWLLASCIGSAALLASLMAKASGGQPPDVLQPVFLIATLLLAGCVLVPSISRIPKVKDSCPPSHRRRRVALERGDDPIQPERTWRPSTGRQAHPDPWLYLMIVSG